MNWSAHSLQSPDDPASAAFRWYSANAASISALLHCPMAPAPPGPPWADPQCGPAPGPGQPRPWREAGVVTGSTQLPRPAPPALEPGHHFGPERGDLVPDRLGRHPRQMDSGRATWPRPPRASEERSAIGPGRRADRLVVPEAAVRPVIAVVDLPLPVDQIARGGRPAKPFGSAPCRRVPRHRRSQQ